MSAEHERIWLAPQCCADPIAGREWASDASPWPCSDCTCDGRGVEYVRADTIAALRERAEKAEAELVGEIDEEADRRAIAVAQDRVRQLLLEARRVARVEALREAAEIAANRHKYWHMSHPDDSHHGDVCDDFTACQDIAAAIRAMIEKEQTDVTE